MVLFLILDCYFLPCDAPARQFLKCVKGHSGFYSCERCEIKGESTDGRLVMAAIDCPSRTDQLFNQYNYHPCTLPDYGICVFLNLSLITCI